MDDISSFRLGRVAPLGALAIAFASACGLSTQARRHRADTRALELLDASAAPAAAASESELELDGQEGALDRAALVRAVLARNPTIAAARHGWRASLAGYRQETALEDPMVEYSFAPLSIGSDHAQFGQTITLSQRFAGPGKLVLRRAIVLAEAKAAEHDFDAVKLELALMASVLFDRYYAVARSLAINEEHERHLEEIRAAAVAQYEAGRASQSDPLRAELELANVLRRSVQLRTEQALVQAEINGLLHRHPNAKLPPPPTTLAERMRVIDDEKVLADKALAGRPELRGNRAAIEARGSAVSLAKRAYVPDFGVMGSYSTMWPELPHRFMLGVSVNLPLQIRARAAGVQQAKAAQRRAQSELEAMTDQIRVEVAQARLRLQEAQKIVELYEGRTLPVALARVEAATAAYETSTGSFEELIEAEQASRTAQLEAEVARAELSQRYAELQRALGETPGLPSEQPSAEGADR